MDFEATSKSLDGYEIRVGTWNDWSRGRILGATLTLSRQDGTLLIAFLAFFIGIVGNRFWRILCVIMHFAYSTDALSDGLHHQRQILLRNVQTPEAGVFVLVSLIRSWRHNSTRVLQRLLPILILALVCLGVSVAAGGFSSRVATLLSSEAVLDGSQCGYLDISSAADNLTALVKYQVPVAVRDVISADSYARNCYTGSSAHSSLNCDTWIRKHVKAPIVDPNAGCPFKKGICQAEDSNLLIDTGYLDSNEDFGRNTPREQSFQYRRVIQCAPLQAQGYTSQINTSRQESFTRYHYGNSIYPDGTEAANYTEQFSNDQGFDLEEMMPNSGDSNRDYSVK